jgi:phage tail sheath protein FI
MNSFKKSGLVLFVMLSMNSMAQIKKPGVFVQEISSAPASVAQVETAIPAFIGYTEKADDKRPGDLRFVARRISNMIDFEKYYGGAASPGISKIQLDASYNVVSATIAPQQYFLKQSVQLFFQNGGRDLYVVSIGGFTSTVQQSDFEKGLLAAGRMDEPTLLLFPDAVSLPGNQLYQVQQKSLEQAGKLADRFCILDLKYAADIQQQRTLVNEFRDQIGSLQLRYGGAYAPYLKAGFLSEQTRYSYWKNAIWINNQQVSPKQLTADPALWQKIDELDTIALTDPNYPTKESGLIRAIPALGKISVWLNQQQVAVPPSGAIAGIYSAVDRNTGVWKAPANISVNGIKGLAVTISSQDQESMNVVLMTGKSVNAIRGFTGKGFLVWGARTLAGNDNEWRYIPVRRLFLMVEESVKKATQAFVFEPNDANTWTKIRAMIENYLTVKWKEGALMGAKPEHAFFVNIGLGKTMTNQDILEGRMNIEVGMAPIKPAEFILLKFQLKMVTK